MSSPAAPESPILASLADDPQDAAAHQRPRRTRLEWLLSICLIGMVAVPLGIKGYPDEVGRWRLAAASEHYLNGDVQSAIRVVDRAIALNPTHVELYLQRAAWHDEVADFPAALRDYEQIYEIAANDPRMLLARAMTYQKMGNVAGALRDLEALVVASRNKGREERATALNTLAYFRAINHRQLEEALQEIDKAIDLLGPNPAFLDTRGFIRYRLGDYETARNDLETALSAYTPYVRSLRRPEERDNLGIADLRVYRIQLHRQQQAFAVVLYHRGLIYEELKESDLATADFDQVRQLGFEPGDDLY